MKHGLFAIHEKLIGLARLTAITASLVVAVQLLLFGGSGVTLDRPTLVVAVAAAWVAAGRIQAYFSRAAAVALSRSRRSSATV